MCCECINLRKVPPLHVLVGAKISQLVSNHRRRTSWFRRPNTFQNLFPWVQAKYATQNLTQHINYLVVRGCVMRRISIFIDVQSALEIVTVKIKLISH